MAVVTFVLGRGADQNTAVSTLTSGAQAPTSGNMLIACTLSKITGGTPAIPTIGGTLAATWTQLGTFQYQTAGANDTRISIFYSLTGPGPPTGTITADWSGVSQTTASFQVVELANTVTTGTNGSDAFPQAIVTSTGSGANGTVSLAALQDSNSMAFGVIGHNVSEAITVGGGFTIISNSFQVPGLSEEYRSNVTTVNGSWTSSAYGIVGFEVAGSNALLPSWDFTPAPILKGP